MTATAAFEHLRKYKIRNALLFSNRLEFLTQDYILLCFSLRITAFVQKIHRLYNISQPSELLPKWSCRF